MDVLESTLFAQLAADKQVDRTQNPRDWNATFNRGLHSMGWTRQSDRYRQISDASQYGTVDNLVLEIMKGELEGDSRESDLQLFQSMVQSLKNDADAIAFFDASAKNGNAATFYAGVGDISDGNVILKISFSRYKISTDITSVFFNSLSGDDVTFDQGNETIILNNDMYSRLRDVVSGKVASYLDQIKEIKL